MSSLARMAQTNGSFPVQFVSKLHFPKINVPAKFRSQMYMDGIRVHDRIKHLSPTKMPLAIHVVMFPSISICMVIYTTAICNAN